MAGVLWPAAVVLVTVAFGLVVDGPVLAAVAAAAAVVGAVAALTRAFGSDGRVRAAWFALGLGLLARAFTGDLLMMVLVATALLLIPPPPRTRIQTTRAVTDILLVGASLLLLTWNIVVVPAGLTGSALVTPVVCTMLATAAVIVPARLRHPVPGADGFGLISLGLLMVAVAAALALRMDGPTGSAGLALVLYAALRRRRPSTLAAQAPAFVVLLPYAAVLASLIIGTALLLMGGRPSSVGTWCRFAVLFLITVRQIVILLENRGLNRDLEARVRHRAGELHARELRYRALVEQSSDSLAILEADSTIRYQSESIERIFGFPAGMLVGKRLVDIVGSRPAPVIAAAITDALGRPGEIVTFEVRLRHADGRYRMAEMTITNLLADPAVRGLVFNTRDVSEARELQDRLRHDAYHDALTGLVNRALFREELRVAAAAGECAVLFLDLDGFKEVNDSLGHAAGDELLVEVAGRLRRAVPEPWPVARLGGDEFAVIVTSGNAADDAENLAAHILAVLDEPCRIDGRELHVGAGIGVASSADAGDIEQLQRNADLAMYRAKDAGGGVYATYHPSMHDALVQRLELADDLRRALDNGDELVLHYQPTVDLGSGEIVGFEALVRWRHPVRGMVPPLDFIGVAESTGLIVPLGRWVLTEACRQAVAWDRPIKMAVNVSVRQFDEGDLAATVAEVLAGTGMPADRLCLEMTESVLLTDTDENLARIVELKALGVMLAMDDFGTGYSSLAYLRRFPMDVLKIDRSFVDRLGAGDEDDALVTTIIRLGRSFGMTTVAEGIENPAQLAALHQMGCDQAQGFHLSRPVPAEAATALLTTGLAIPVLTP